jgi:hypothetical protein
LGFPDAWKRPPMTDDPKTPKIVYGAAAIGNEICEPNLRSLFHRLENNQIPGAWKAGRTWALTVPVFRRAVGLDTE